MRLVILAALATFCIAGVGPVVAQTRAPPSAPSVGTIPPAPVGHRQPTVHSVEAAGGTTGSAPSGQHPRADPDKGLIICRGC